MTEITRAAERDAAEFEQCPSLVLLVDDQPIVGEAVRRLLIGAPDIDLHYCPNAAEAIAIANDLRPTVILQDLVLPNTDGLDVVRRFRANRQTAITPIVVLSTKEDPVIKGQAFAAGANDYLVKLPDRVELIARVRYHSNAYVSQLQRDEAFHALRESQRQLLQTNTALLSLNQQLNEFVGMAAHDLRNPLGVVLGFAKYLQRDGKAPLTDQQRNFVSTIQSSTEFMLRLVNDLLDVAKIEAGELKLNLQRANLCAVAEANVKLNQILAAEKQITITYACDASVPVMVDAHRMEQVLNNLLTNAIKFSHPGTRIDVAVGVVDGEVRLVVRDQGQGIPPEEIGKLFTPFGVTSVRGTGGEKSTGLGLMIAKKVVDAHGGRIHVESTPGHGSTFVVAFPAA